MGVNPPPPGKWQITKFFQYVAYLRNNQKRGKMTEKVKRKIGKWDIKEGPFPFIKLGGAMSPCK